MHIKSFQLRARALSRRLTEMNYSEMPSFSEEFDHDTMEVPLWFLVSIESTPRGRFWPKMKNFKIEGFSRSKVKGYGKKVFLITSSEIVVLYVKWKSSVFWVFWYQIHPDRTTGGGSTASGVFDVSRLPPNLGGPTAEPLGPLDPKLCTNFSFMVGNHPTKFDQNRWSWCRKCQKSVYTWHGMPQIKRATVTHSGSCYRL